MHEIAGDVGLEYSDSRHARGKVAAIYPIPSSSDLVNSFRIVT